MQLQDYHTLDVPTFSKLSRIGQTTVRQMFGDGRLKGARIGEKKLVVIVSSCFEMVEREAAKGIGEYKPIKKAHAARQKQIEDGLRRPGPGRRAEERKEKKAEADAFLKELGL